ncbi:MAG: glycerophosphoryl diester phosphodiesterase [Candidatus Promineifilaceae bacterium]|jgi:glycerophosphoryl diester phosphodiesterase
MQKIGRFFLFILALLGIIYSVLLLISLATPVAQIESGFDFGRPVVIAHQGGDGIRPSNTMAAFTHAVDLGVDVLEMDIHSTKDGVLVAIHDDTVDRTTNGTGRVQDFTFAELQQLDAGYNWPTLAEESLRADRPFRGKGITIPSLEEVLIAFPDVPLNIEIKQQEPSIVAPFCELLKKYDRMGPNQVLVPSFHPETITEFREICPGVPTAVVQNEVVTFFVLNKLQLHRIWSPPAEAFQVPRESAGLTIITSSFVHNLQNHGVIVHPWTINSQSEMRNMLELGVDGIITDYPNRLLEIIDSK